MLRKRKYLLVAYGLDILLLLMLICVPYATMMATNKAGALVGYAHDVRQKLSDVTGAVSDVIIERNNYLLTGNPHYLKNVAGKSRRLTEESQGLEQLVHDPTQRDRAEQLLVLVRRFNAGMLQDVEGADIENTLERAFYVADTDASAREIKAVAAKIDAAEEMLLEQRRKSYSQKMTAGIILSLALGMTAAAGLFWLLARFRKELHRREALEQDLIETRRAAEKGNQAKAHFLASMSHEIRAPLGAIIGYAELLTDPTTPADERQEYTQTILRNGRHLNQVVDDILDLSKIEAGALVVEKIPCKPSEIVADVIASLSQKARAKAIHLRAENIGEPSPTVLSDPKILRQILLNLVGNAIKFTDQGEVVVRCRGQLSSDSSQVKLDITVTDTGRGINECERSKLFREFSQGEAAIGRLYGGTGLGLALSRNLARSLQGDLQLRASTFGVGSTFGLSLFAEVVATQRIQVASPPLLAYRVPQGGTALIGRSILLADDAVDNQFLIAQILRASGATVDVVGDGVDAVESALKNHYDIVLMDIQMPHLDGYAATAQLRQRGYDRPILALSAHALKEERQKSMASGCNDHISKPIDRWALVDTIAKFCPSEASALH